MSILDAGQIPSLFSDLSRSVSELDFDPIMIATLELLAEGEEQAFNAGANPSTGEAWVPNAESTIKRKGHGIVLFEAGALEESLIGVGNEGNIHETSHRGLLFGTDIPYSLFNQEGTSRIPARPHVGMNPKLIDFVAEEVLESAIEQLRG